MRFNHTNRVELRSLRDEIAKIAARITSRHWMDAPQMEAARAKWQTTGLERDKDYICSEYAWECYHALGLNIANDPRGFVTPADFANDPKVDILATLESE